MRAVRPVVHLKKVEAGYTAELHGHTAYPGGVRVMNLDQVDNALLVFYRMCDCAECDACLVGEAFALLQEK